MDTFDTLGESVVHQQDCLLSHQLRPTFPPAWMEQGTIRLKMGLVHQSAVIEHHPLNQTQPYFHTAKPQPIRGFPTIEPGTF